MQNCNDITVRRATLRDAVAVATYVWQTDAYIYPSVVASPDEPIWLDFIARSLTDAGSVFFCDRVLVAEVQGKVVGVCTFFRCGAALHFVMPTAARIHEGLDYVDREYYRPLIAEYAARDGLCISNLCVDANFRSCGVGGKLLDGVFALFPNCDIVLDVIEDNHAACRLYEKKGFAVTKRYMGFGGKTNASVPCLEMVRPHAK